MGVDVTAALQRYLAAALEQMFRIELVDSLIYCVRVSVVRAEDPDSCPKEKVFIDVNRHERNKRQIDT